MYNLLMVYDASVWDLPSTEFDVPPVLSSRPIWSPIPNETEIGREEAVYRRADHRLPA